MDITNNNGAFSIRYAGNKAFIPRGTTSFPDSDFDWLNKVFKRWHGIAITPPVPYIEEENVEPENGDEPYPIIEVIDEDDE